VSFQYGTAFGEASFVGGCSTGCTPGSVPEPASLLLMGPAVAYAVRRVQRAKVAP